jgi:hypothetical protein
MWAGILASVFVPQAARPSSQQLLGKLDALQPAPAHAPKQQQPRPVLARLNFA